MNRLKEWMAYHGGDVLLCVVVLILISVAWIMGYISAHDAHQTLSTGSPRCTWIILSGKMPIHIWLCH